MEALRHHADLQAHGTTETIGIDHDERNQCPPQPAQPTTATSAQSSRTTVRPTRRRAADFPVGRVKGFFETSQRDGYATVDTSDRQRRIAGYARVSMTHDRYMSRGRVHPAVAALMDRTVAKPAALNGE